MTKRLRILDKQSLTHGLTHSNPKTPSFTHSPTPTHLPSSHSKRKYSRCIFFGDRKYKRMWFCDSYFNYIEFFDGNVKTHFIFGLTPWSALVYCFRTNITTHLLYLVYQSFQTFPTSIHFLDLAMLHIYLIFSEYLYIYLKFSALFYIDL